MKTVAVKLLFRYIRNENLSIPLLAIIFTTSGHTASKKSISK